MHQSQVITLHVLWSRSFFYKTSTQTTGKQHQLWPKLSKNPEYTGWKPKVGSNTVEMEETLNWLTMCRRLPLQEHTLQDYPFKNHQLQDYPSELTNNLTQPYQHGSLKPYTNPKSYKSMSSSLQVLKLTSCPQLSCVQWWQGDQWTCPNTFVSWSSGKTLTPPAGESWTRDVWAYLTRLMSIQARVP